MTTSVCLSRISAEQKRRGFSIKGTIIKSIVVMVTYYDNDDGGDDNFEDYIHS
jgi:hypothetical protein